MGVIYESVTIANNEAVSSAIELNGRRVTGLIGPTAWTAADYSFEVYEPISAAWRKVIDSAGALVKVTGAATTTSEVMLLPEIADKLIANRIRVVSSNTGSEADVNQGAARTFYVLIETR